MLVCVPTTNVAIVQKSEPISVEPANVEEWPTQTAQPPSLLLSVSWSPQAHFPQWQVLAFNSATMEPLTSYCVYLMIRVAKATHNTPHELNKTREDLD